MKVCHHSLSVDNCRFPVHKESFDVLYECFDITKDSFDVLNVRWSLPSGLITVWTTQGLQEVLRQRQHIFLVYLRVYQLPQPIEVAVNPNSQEKTGKFCGLPNSLNVSESSPVLSDRIFTQRRRQLEKLESPPHPELEELQSAIAQLNNSAAQQLNNAEAWSS